jgi:hypothetical protein
MARGSHLGLGKRDSLGLELVFAFHAVYQTGTQPWHLSLLNDVYYSHLSNPVQTPFRPINIGLKVEIGLRVDVTFLSLLGKGNIY